MSRRDHNEREPDVLVEFDHRPEAARQARRALRPLIGEPGDPIAEAVELVTSELVSNVLQHTSDGGSVKAWDPKPDKPFRLEVADSEPRPPSPSQFPDQTGGRGLGIVDSLSDSWGVDGTATGKTVWAEFNRPS